MKKLLSVIVVMSLAGAAVVFGLRHKTNQAILTSIHGAASAIANADWEGLSKYVDIDSASLSIARASLERLNKQFGLTGEDVAELERMIEDEGFDERLALDFKDVLRTIVETSMIDTLKARANAPVSPFTLGPAKEPALPDRLELGHASFEGVTGIARTDGAAEALIAVRYDVLDTTFALPVGLVRRNKEWQIVDVSRLVELANGIDARKALLVNRANQQILGDGAGIMWDPRPIVSFRSTPIGSGRFMGRMESVEARFLVRNEGDRPVKDLKFKLFVRDFPRNYATVRVGETLQPGESTWAHYSDIYLQDRLLHMVIKEHRSRELEMSLVEFTVVDEDGEDLRRGYVSWDMMRYAQAGDKEA